MYGNVRIQFAIAQHNRSIPTCHYIVSMLQTDYDSQKTIIQNFLHQPEFPVCGVLRNCIIIMDCIYDSKAFIERTEWRAEGGEERGKEREESGNERGEKREERRERRREEEDNSCRSS